MHMCTGDEGNKGDQLEDTAYVEDDHPQEEYDGAGRRLFNRNERLLIFTHCQGKCFFCYRPLDFAEGWFSVHLDPTRSEDYTVVTNGVASCRECTGRKGELTHHQFVEQFGGKGRVPSGLRCHGFTPDLVRCEAVVAGVGVFCCDEHHQLYQYVQDNTGEDCAEEEEVDGQGRRLFNKNERKLIHFHCKGECFYCGERFRLEEPWEADHLIPWSKEGRTTVVNGVLACRDCNRWKSNMTHHEFVKKYGGKNGIYKDIHCHGYETVSRRCFNFTTGTRHYCADTDGECQKVRLKVKRSL